MDKIAKAIAKLTPKNKIEVKHIFLKLAAGDTGGLDVKKLKGYDNLYRVRKGKLRIIYQKSGNQVLIVRVGNRNETTYRK